MRADILFALVASLCVGVAESHCSSCQDLCESAALTLGIQTRVIARPERLDNYEYISNDTYDGDGSPCGDEYDECTGSRCCNGDLTCYGKKESYAQCEKKGKRKALCRCQVHYTRNISHYNTLDQDTRLALGKLVIRNATYTVEPEYVGHDHDYFGAMTARYARCIGTVFGREADEAEFCCSRCNVDPYYTRDELAYESLDIFKLDELFSEQPEARGRALSHGFMKLKTSLEEEADDICKETTNSSDPIIEQVYPFVDKVDMQRLCSTLSKQQCISATSWYPVPCVWRSTGSFLKAGRLLTSGALNSFPEIMYNKAYNENYTKWHSTAGDGKCTAYTSTHEFCKELSQRDCQRLRNVCTFTFTGLQKRVQLGRRLGGRQAYEQYITKDSDPKRGNCTAKGLSIQELRGRIFSRLAGGPKKANTSRLIGVVTKIVPEVPEYRA